MPVAVQRTKSAYDLPVHDLRAPDKAYWNGRSPVFHVLPSKQALDAAPEDGSISYPSNIDEVPVLDDPRQWSQRRKVGGYDTQSAFLVLTDDCRSSLYLSSSHMLPLHLTLVFLSINVSMTFSGANLGTKTSQRLLNTSSSIYMPPQTKSHSAFPYLF